MEEKQELLIGRAPFIRDENSTSKIMTHVLVAMLPALLMSGIVFGGRALMLTGVCILTAMLWERICNLVMRRPNSTGDLSAAVTGMLLGFMLPSGFPYLKAALGTLIAIVVFKQLFGGLGKNLLNPALAGRLALQFIFADDMQQWIAPFTNYLDHTIGEVPLETGMATYYDLFLGSVCGGLGEVCALAMLLALFYLTAMRVTVPIAPLTYIASVAVFSYAVGNDGIYQVLTGSVLITAVFAASDSVTTPMTALGKILFGIGCGAITCAIRFFTPLGEGAVIAVLVMDLLVPLIDKATEKSGRG